MLSYSIRDNTHGSLKSSLTLQRIDPTAVNVFISLGGDAAFTDPGNRDVRAHRPQAGDWQAFDFLRSSQEGEPSLFACVPTRAEEKSNQTDNLPGIMSLPVHKHTFVAFAKIHINRKLSRGKTIVLLSSQSDGK